MQNINLKLISFGILLFLAVLSGIWLHRKGKPLNKVIFTIHKLISLACIIAAGMSMYVTHNYIDLPKSVVLIIVSAAFFLLLSLISGGFLSFEKPYNFIFLILHRISTVLVIISCSFLVYALWPITI